MSRQAMGATLTPAGALADRPRGFEPIGSIIERVLEPILARQATPDEPAASAKSLARVKPTTGGA